MRGAGHDLCSSVVAFFLWSESLEWSEITRLNLMGKGEGFCGEHHLTLK